VPQIIRGRGETMGESSGQGRAQEKQKFRILSTIASSRVYILEKIFLSVGGNK